MTKHALWHMHLTKPTRHCPLASTWPWNSSLFCPLDGLVCTDMPLRNYSLTHAVRLLYAFMTRAGGYLLHVGYFVSRAGLILLREGWFPDVTKLSGRMLVWRWVRLRKGDTLLHYTGVTLDTRVLRCGGLSASDRRRENVTRVRHKTVQWMFGTWARPDSGTIQGDKTWMVLFHCLHQQKWNKIW